MTFLQAHDWLGPVALVFLALVLAVGVMSCRDYWDEP